uniref:Uncharacterized protein n=1 Tax=Ciona savignyi TaxID=51511 RepID=H2YMF9_CIOSA
MSKCPPVPDLLASSGGEDDSSDEEDSRLSTIIKGDFPWGNEKTNNTKRQIEMLVSLGPVYQGKLLQVALVYLSYPVLIHQAMLPRKWMEWGAELGMCDLVKIDSS